MALINQLPLIYNNKFSLNYHNPQRYCIISTISLTFGTKQLMIIITENSFRADKQRRSVQVPISRLNLRVAGLGKKPAVGTREIRRREYKYVEEEVCATIIEPARYASRESAKRGTATKATNATRLERRRYEC